MGAGYGWNALTCRDPRAHADERTSSGASRVFVRGIWPKSAAGGQCIGILGAVRSGSAVVVGSVAVLALVGCAGPSVRISPPPAGASAAVVIDTYLRALVAGDCATAHALATSTFTGNGELCGLVKVSSFSLNRDPATAGRDEVIYGSVLVTEGSRDGTIPRGKVTWFYDLKRQDGAWKLAGGGTGP